MGKKTIWMNDSLIKLAADVGNAKGRAGKFSARLGDIVERYELVIRLTPVPELSDIEKTILDEVILGSTLTPTTIRYMPEAIMDCDAGSVDERISLHDKIASWTPAERIAVIEALGL